MTVIIVAVLSLPALFPAAPRNGGFPLLTLLSLRLLDSFFFLLRRRCRRTRRCGLRRYLRFFRHIRRRRWRTCRRWFHCDLRRRLLGRLRLLHRIRRLLFRFNSRSLPGGLLCQKQRRRLQNHHTANKKTDQYFFHPVYFLLHFFSPLFSPFSRRQQTKFQDYYTIITKNLQQIFRGFSTLFLS